MNLLLLFLILFLASLVKSLCDIYNTPICATFNNVNMTFPNIWEMFNLFKATGQFWVPVATGACFKNGMDCTILNPVCAVTNDNFFKTFPNQCLLEAEQKTTGTVWNILYNGICLEVPSDVHAPLKTNSSFLQASDFVGASNNDQQYYDIRPSFTPYNNTKPLDSVLAQSENFNQDSAHVPVAIYPIRSNSSSYDSSPLVVASDSYKPVQIQQLPHEYNQNSDLELDKSATLQSQNSDFSNNYYRNSATKLEILAPIKSDTPSSYSDAPVSATEHKLHHLNYFNKDLITNPLVSAALQSNSMSYDTAPSPSSGQQSYTSTSHKQSSSPYQVIAAPLQPISSVLAQPFSNKNEVIAPTPAIYMPSYSLSSHNLAQLPTSEYYREGKISLNTLDYNSSSSPNLVNMQIHAPPVLQMEKTEITEKYNTAPSLQLSDDFNHNLRSLPLQSHSSPPHYVLHNLVQAPQTSFISGDLPQKMDEFNTTDFKSALKLQLPASFNQSSETNPNISVSLKSKTESKPTGIQNKSAQQKQNTSSLLQSNLLSLHGTPSSATSEQQSKTLADLNQSLTPSQTHLSSLYVTTPSFLPEQFNFSKGSHTSGNFNQSMASNSSILTFLLSHLPPPLNSVHSHASDYKNAANEAQAPLISIKSRQSSVMNPSKSTPLLSHSLSSHGDATLLNSGNWNSSKDLKTWTDYKESLAAVATASHLSPVNKGMHSMRLENYGRAQEPKTSPVTDGDNEVLIINPGTSLSLQAKSPQLYNVKTSPATENHHTTPPIPPASGTPKPYSSTSAAPEKYKQNTKQLPASKTANSISKNLNKLSVQAQAAADLPSCYSPSTTSVPTPDPSYNKQRSGAYPDSTISSSTAKTNADQIFQNNIEESDHQTNKRNLASSENSYGSLLSDQEQSNSESYSQHLITNSLLQTMLPVVIQKHSELPHLINKICLHVLKFLMIIL